jgi:ATP-binding cassette subfamily B protein
MIKVNLGNLLPHADDKTKTTSLSGGQRQRIGLARALVRNSSVFVFDESSSALDSFTESEVLANIKETTKGKTSIMITHRVVTLRNADEVLIIENGKIVEQGNPVNLLKQSGVFSRYWQAQMGNS